MVSNDPLDGLEIEDEKKNSSLLWKEGKIGLKASRNTLTIIAGASAGPNTVEA